MSKLLTFAQFEKAILREDKFHEAIATLRWLSRVESESIAFPNKILREMFVEYLRVHRTVEKETNRIGRSSSSRFS